MMSIHSKKATVSSSFIVLLCVLLFSRATLRGESHEDLPMDPVKTVETEDGDVIHCLPALTQAQRNHQEIEIPPVHESAKEETLPKRYKALLAWSKKGGCPKRSIPVWKYNKNYSLRQRGQATTQSSSDFNGVNARRSLNPRHRVLAKKEYALLELKRKIRGASAGISVWKPTVERNDISLAYVKVAAGEQKTETDVIEAGWQVNPSRNQGDPRPHLFVYMSGNNNDRGCYDYECPLEFVPNPECKIPLGTPLAFSSSDAGKIQYDFKLEMDAHGNWHFWFGPFHVGYWPSTSLHRLSLEATAAYYGGEVATEKVEPPHTTTQMGSGRLPASEGNVASFTNVKFMSPNPSTWFVPMMGELKDVTTQPKCYSLKNVGHRSEPSAGYTFYYGGPGYNEQCKQ